ncbi:MAG: hypothetical protein M5R41_18025 [Bacteroidia bacterium]|nr:hypothetical protein [Bacteroidia bacterium]
MRLHHNAQQQWGYCVRKLFTKGRRARAFVGVFVCLMSGLSVTLSAQGSYEKHFHSFMFTMQSEITISDQDSESRIGVRLRDIALHYDEAEDAYLGEGDLEHTLFELSLSPDCEIKEPLYRSDRFYVRVEVEEYHDAAPTVRLFLRMRGDDVSTMAGEGAIIECQTSNGPRTFRFDPVPYWAAGWFVVRGDLGEDPAAPHGWPIRDLVVEGWQITGIEDEKFRIRKVLDHTAVDTSGAEIREVATYELLPCLEYSTGFEMPYDAYAFANEEAIVWPESYWTTFRYELEDEIFRELTGNPPRSRYPDWYSFERAFGEAQVLRSNVPRVFNPAALLRWKHIAMDTFRGACYGFVYSSLLHYTGLRNVFPRPIAGLTIDDAVRDEIISKHLYQISREGALADAAERNTRPRQLIEKLIANFREDGRRNRGLAVFIAGNAHSMVPMRIRRCVQGDGSDIMSEIDVWDNYEPTKHRTVTVNETQNRIIGSGSELSRGFYPDAQADVYTNPYPTMPKSGVASYPALMGGDWTEVYHRGDGTAQLVAGERGPADIHAIDYEASPDFFNLQIKTGTVPFIPGCFVANTLADRLILDLEAAGKESITVLRDGYSFDMDFEADPGTSLRAQFQTDAGTLAIATDGAMRDIVLFLARTAGNTDEAIRLIAKEFAAADSLHCHVGAGETYAVITNPGTEKTVTLELLRFGDVFTRSGRFPDITLETGATVQLVTGNNDSLATTRIALRVDSNGDGQMDEERLLRDYLATSVDAHTMPIAEMGFWPSPWDARQPVRMHYTFRNPTSARLVVYDILQRVVVELVPPTWHHAGARYETFWDGRDARGYPVPAGIYLYSLESNDGSRLTGKIPVFR